MSAQLADNELLITRTFDAPASLVFSMWSDPEHFKNWMGPETFDCPVVEMDFRVGGAYRAMIRSDEHGENWFGGVYKEIERYSRLVFTFIWDSGGPSDGVETTVTILFRETGGKTEQIFHQAGILNADRRDSQFGGWSSAFEKEHAYLMQFVKVEKE
ncbi:SRPBCC domain-containing protein [Hyphococcus flavus]|uniref:SRPBCC domain-containing protein n=1 Tax=Hyphococcus flavus TaxID=1866326 RepID=A0AAF0CEX4_9PROT|nr:SRPBCC domain-containing protein [Hyphococcus flavus]WDI30193.1 SRPBCC domain-containing protein [Hyphococcus flavus]